MPAIVPDWHTEAAALHNDMLRIAVRIYLHSCMPLAKPEETSLPGVGDASTQNCCVFEIDSQTAVAKNQMHKCSLYLPDAYIYPELEELATIIACRRAPFACDGHKARSRDPHSLGADRGDCMELFRGNLHKIQCSKSDITQLTFQLPDEAFGLKSKTLSTHLRKPADRTPVWRGGFLLA